MEFSTGYQSILDQLDQIDPVAYGRTRNFVNGSVTRLSPYISRGVISTRQVLMHVLQRGYVLEEIESFAKELCWRDYFQRVAQVKDVNAAIKQPQSGVMHDAIPSAVVNAQTGIEGIDSAILDLYRYGYMHNHCRMYTASLVCNIARSHWHHPARWMYYHLLDGDFASNACSWQWVAGTNSSKKYYANQENINKYTASHQTGTFLDNNYEALERMLCPPELSKTEKKEYKTVLPQTSPVELNQDEPVFLYNYYNLDPLWHRHEKGNRILLLEPEIFEKYPVSEKCIQFMLELSKNIPGIRVYTGSFDSLFRSCNNSTVYYKEHPLNYPYKGICEERDWIDSQLAGYYPSFFAYWKRISKNLIHFVRSEM